MIRVISRAEFQTIDLYRLLRFDSDALSAGRSSINWTVLVRRAHSRSHRYMVSQRRRAFDLKHKTSQKDRKQRATVGVQHVCAQMCPEGLEVNWRKETGWVTSAYLNGAPADVHLCSRIICPLQ